MIGVYGGTFDPVHFGHLRTALEVQEVFRLDELRLIPCFMPPHRDTPTAAADRRVTMLELAIEDYDRMKVDTREIDRGGPSYMVDTLASIRQEFGSQPILLFIGGDAFLNLTGWHHWQQLFELAHVVVMTRPGFEQPKLNRFYQDRLAVSIESLQQAPSGCLFFQQVTALDISATAIRQMIAENRNPGFLLPDSVIEYIRKNKLYQCL
ncbi:MAG: nicotinate-nucleotide adenylyltransferase [Gammaproteobacteria bacterium]